MRHGRAKLPDTRTRHALLAALRTSTAKHAGDERDGAQTIVVGGDHVRDAQRVDVRVHDADRRHARGRALGEQRAVLARVQHDHQVGHQRGRRAQLVGEAPDAAVAAVDDVARAAAEDALRVRQRAGDPAREEVASAGAAGGVDDDARVAGAGADEEDEACACGDGAHDGAGAAQVRGCCVGGDDVDGVAGAGRAARAEDVGGVGWVPELRGVAEVRLAGEEELQGYG